MNLNTESTELPIESCTFNNDDVSCTPTGLSLPSSYVYWPIVFAVDDTFCKAKPQ